MQGLVSIWLKGELFCFAFSHVSVYLYWSNLHDLWNKFCLKISLAVKLKLEKKKRKQGVLWIFVGSSPGGLSTFFCWEKNYSVSAKTTYHALASMVFPRSICLMPEQFLKPWQGCKLMRKVYWAWVAHMFILTYQAFSSHLERNACKLRVFDRARATFKNIILK